MAIAPLSIAICGYGTAAQAAALLLRAQGHAISIFERSAVLAPVGAGFLLQPTGLAVLRFLGLAEHAKYCALRSSHVGIYQLISRWLTPLFQSHSRSSAWLRDSTFYPMSRLPLVRSSMLRTLSGLQQGYFGVYDGIDVGK